MIRGDGAGGAGAGAGIIFSVKLSGLKMRWYKKKTGMAIQIYSCPNVRYLVEIFPHFPEYLETKL